MSHTLQKVKISRDDKAWEVEIRAEIPPEAMARYREETLKEMQRDAKLDGFRPGKAPIERIIAIYGEPTVLRHAAQHAIEHELPELLAAENLLIVESPRVETAAPDQGKPLSFTARAPLAPRVELPDYKKLAAGIPREEDITVSDKEHAEAMVHLKRERARIDKIEAGTDPQKAAEQATALAEADLPALDDLFVQQLGYENAEKFSDALSENIKNEKTIQAAEKRRAAILDELVKRAKINYPTLLREYELDDMEARLNEDLAWMRMTFDQYLAQVKKTREQLREEWKDAADKRAKVRLILTEISRQERVEPDAERLAHEIEHAKKAYPQAKEDVLRAHISHALRNDATLKFLEAI